MRKLFVVFFVIGSFLVSAGPVSACPKEGDHVHPFLVLEHAKELGLSKKQRSQIKKIEKNLKNEMHGVWKKYGEEMGAVLTDVQRERFVSLIN